MSGKTLVIALLAIFAAFAIFVAWSGAATPEDEPMVVCESPMLKGAILPDGRVEPNGTTLFKQPKGCGRIRDGKPWRSITP